MICIATKNDAIHLPSFYKHIEQLDYPHEKLRFVYLYGNSTDFTLDTIIKFHKSHDYKYEVYKEQPFVNPTKTSLWIADLQNQFKQHYKDEDYILCIDTDVTEFPSNLLTELVKHDKDIIAPYVYLRGNHFYDTYCFRVNGETFNKHRSKTGIIPFTNSTVPVELDCVGTCFLVKAKVFLTVNWSNPVPHYQFCKEAKLQGYSIWALPYLHIQHAILTEAFENFHYPVEYYIKNGVLPVEIYAKMSYPRKLIPKRKLGEKLRVAIVTSFVNENIENFTSKLSNIVQSKMFFTDKQLDSTEFVSSIFNYKPHVVHFFYIYNDNSINELNKVIRELQFYNIVTVLSTEHNNSILLQITNPDGLYYDVTAPTVDIGCSTLKTVTPYNLTFNSEKAIPSYIEWLTQTYFESD